MIDPDFWQDEKASQLSILGRIILLGIITIANDYGKLRGRSTYIKNLILPFDDIPTKEVEESLIVIESLGIIKRYQINGETFIILNNWSRYQTLRHPAKDNIPNPTDNNGNYTDNNGVLTAQDKISKGKLSEEKRKPLPSGEGVPLPTKKTIVQLYCEAHEKHFDFKPFENAKKKINIPVKEVMALQRMITLSGEEKARSWFIPDKDGKIPIFNNPDIMSDPFTQKRMFFPTALYDRIVLLKHKNKMEVVK